MRLSIAFQTDKPISAYGALAAQAEAYGFDGVSLYNDMLYQPPWLPLLEMARATTRVRLGPAAVNPFLYHPIAIAGDLALLDEASGGRAYLGMTRGAWLDFVGIEPARPVTALREALECVRHLLARSTTPYRGEIFKLAGGDALRWEILRADVPFMLGAWGERTIRACLPYIAEVKLGGTANPALVRHIRRFLDDACGAAGRDPASVGIVVGAVSVAAEDGDAARTLARRQVALYLPVVAALDSTLAIEAELLEQLKTYGAQFDFDNAARLISDELLSKFAFAGTPDDIAAQTYALFKAGAARVEFGTPHGFTEAEGMKLLGERVLARLRVGE